MEPNLLIYLIIALAVTTIGAVPLGLVNLSVIEGLVINAGPKILAARIGLVFSTVILFASAIGWYETALAFTAVLGLFTFMEAALGICVACKIYPFVYRFLYKTKV